MGGAHSQKDLSSWGGLGGPEEETSGAEEQRRGPEAAEGASGQGQGPFGPAVEVVTGRGHVPASFSTLVGGPLFALALSPVRCRLAPVMELIGQGCRQTARHSSWQRGALGRWGPTVLLTPASQAGQPAAVPQPGLALPRRMKFQGRRVGGRAPFLLKPRPPKERLSEPHPGAGALRV